ncbi:MAG: YadA-like family protein [Deltaproteobacteria bacterium]
MKIERKIRKEKIRKKILRALTIVAAIGLLLAPANQAAAVRTDSISDYEAAGYIRVNSDGAPANEGFYVLVGYTGAIDGTSMSYESFQSNSVFYALSDKLVVNQQLQVNDNFVVNKATTSEIIPGFPITIYTPAFTVNSDTGNTQISGTLSVTGATTLSSTLGVTGLTTTTGGITNNNKGIAATGAITGATTIGASGIISGVGLVSTGGMSNSGGVFDNNSQGITNAGAIDATTITTSGLATLNSASVTNNLTVGGTTTLTGELTANGGITSGAIHVNDGTSGANNISGVTTLTAGTVNATTGNITALNSSTINNNGALNQTGTSTLIGTTNINTSGTATTNIGTAGGATNIGSAASTNTILGTTNTIQAGVNKIVVAAPSTGSGVLISGSTSGSVSNDTAGRLVGAVSISGSGGGANLKADPVWTLVDDGLTSKTSGSVTYNKDTKLVTDSSTGAIYDTTTGVGNWADVAIMSNSGTAGIRINDYGVQIISAPVTGNQVATNDIGTSTGNGTIINNFGGGGDDGGTVINTIGKGGINGGKVTNSIGDGGATTTTVNNTIGTGSSSSGTVTNDIGLGGSGTGPTNNNFGSSTGGGDVTNVIGSGTLGSSTSITANTIGAGGAGTTNNSIGSAGVAGSTTTNSFGTATAGAGTVINNIGTGAGVSTTNIGNTNKDTTATVKGGNSTLSIANDAANMNVSGGGSFSAAPTYATMSGTGTLATNSTVGNTSHIGAGAVTVFNANAVQTIAANTTIQTTLSPTGILDGKKYQNKVNGNLFVDGNVYINGTLDYVSSNSANTTVVGNTGTSKLVGATGGTTAGTAIVMKDSAGTQTVVDGNGKLTNVVTTGAAESTASMTLTNGDGNTHGVVVTETQTTISGGRNSSALTFHDDGATFSNTSNGLPVRVHGVADGTDDFDAVNYRQLRKAYIGIASVSALSALPALKPGRKFGIGAGYGYFQGSNAVAIGLKAAIWDNLDVSAGVGLGYGESTTTFTTNAGFMYNF